MKSRSLLLALCITVSLHAQRSNPAAVAAGSMDRSAAYSYARELASAKYGGRLTGTRGYTDAAHWVAEEFRTWGLKPGNEPMGYFQTFPAPHGVVSRAALSVRTAAGKDTALALAADFLPLLYTDNGRWSAPAVFAGWGVSAPEAGYDDYAGVDVTGKVVLCYRGLPPRNDTLLLRHDEHRQRMKTAKEKGAVALFYIYENPIANPNGDFIAGFTPAVISNRAADLLLAGTGWTAAVLRDTLTHRGTPLSRPLSVTLTYSVTTDFNADGRGVNVVGMKVGSDPVLRNEYIVLGAHLDHCGTHAGVMFPGANDNGSGSAVVMAIAEQFAKSPAVNTKRTILFVLFGGEEMGLKGSNAFVSSRLKQIRAITGMLNFDMVGEGDGAWVGYSATDPALKGLVELADTAVHIARGVSPMEPVRGSGNTDFAPFMKAGVPCVNFSSNGPHLSYHQSGDTIFRLNPDMLADMARLGFLTAAAMANR